MVKSLPPLPKCVHHALGPVKVVVVPDLKAPDGEEVFGLWDGFSRTISVRAGLDPVAGWLTLMHERTHLDLAEIGVVMTTDQIEAVCNAIAFARVAEMLASTPRRSRR